MKTTTRSAAVIAIALLTAACGGPEEPVEEEAVDLNVAPGVTDDSVTIGTHQPLTGPAASGFIQVSEGAGAVFDFVNDNGGVNGREINYVVEDDAYDPARTVEATQKLVLEDEIFAMVGALGTSTHETVINFLNEEGVPDLFVSSGAFMWNSPREYPLTYGYQADYSKEAKIQGKYIAENFPDADIGYFYQNGDVGTDSQAGLDQYLIDDVVAREDYASDLTDISSQIAELKKSGADVVVCSCHAPFMALALVEAASIDYDPTWMVSSIGGDTEILKPLLEEFTAGTAAEEVRPEAFLDGLLSTNYLPQVEMVDDPWSEFFAEVYEEYGEGDLTNTHVYGMAQAVIFSQVLKAAGEDLTRQGLIDALHAGDWSGPGLVPFESSEENRGGFAGAFVNEYRAGAPPEMLQEPMATDRDGGEIEPAEIDRPDPEEADFHDGS
ncbi:ABC transporter substrate-binding protein [Allosalinactinospora lopnorensis]|uniref:ABC transporter substrate-binding protein n=1 Tax=Allosalinactinospora lopnorensis TaxID=1352348 RepID=UPI000623F71D|nr:ABC transporter substrate-binding protein [Allosalinactinospora lopnorensis]